MSDEMIFASALSTEREAEAAVTALTDQLGAKFAGGPPDLALLFAAGHALLNAAQIAQGVYSAIGPRAFVACTAEGVIGQEHEIERRPAVALVAARLPGVELAPFAIEPEHWQEVLDNSDTFRGAVAALANPKLFICLADPFTSPMDGVLEAFNNWYPGVPLIGGMASGADRPGGNLLVLNDELMHAGAVGVALSGDFDVEIVVSQGCRPIGRAFTVTEAQENVILSIEGEPPLHRIREMVAALPDEDRALLGSGLFVGRAIEPGEEEPGRGDFLIRGVMGGDPESGAIAVGDRVHTGEKIQFQVRDAATAQEDLEMMLLPQTFLQPPAGAFLFSCNGRGTRLYAHPDGDIRAITEMLGVVPLAGFFCAGEIGPIGGRNFLHGHTASMALFRPSR